MAEASAQSTSSCETPVIVCELLAVLSISSFPVEMPVFSALKLES